METKTEPAKKKYKLIIKNVKLPIKENKKYFEKIPELLISYNIFPFFNINEAKELGKINQIFKNGFKRNYDEQCDLLTNKYNIKLEKEYEPYEIYEQKDDKGHFIKLSFNKIEHYLLFSYFKWTWQEDERYWDKIKPKNSLFDKEICHLKSVCWVDVNANMSHVFNGKYKLYLNHCVCKLAKNMLKMTVLIDNVPLQEFKYPSDEQVNKCRTAHSDKKEEDKKEEDKKEENKKEEDKKEEDKKDENKNMDINLIDNVIQPHLIGIRNRFGIRGPFLRVNRGIRRYQNITYNKDNELLKDFIMDIDILYDDKLDNGNGHEIKVKFDHVEGSWKEGWLIDAVILEKVEAQN